MRYLIDTNVFIDIVVDDYISNNDPSDRLIISQALTEKIPLISSDTKFPKYRKYGLNLIVNR